VKNKTSNIKFIEGLSIAPP